MRIVYLQQVDTLPAPIPAGTEIDVMPEVGERMIRDGRAAEVLADGDIRRRRGRPRADEGSKVKRAAANVRSRVRGAVSGSGSSEAAPSRTARETSAGGA